MLWVCSPWGFGITKFYCGFFPPVVEEQAVTFLLVHETLAQKFLGSGQLQGLGTLLRAC